MRALVSLALILVTGLSQAGPDTVGVDRLLGELRVEAGRLDDAGIRALEADLNATLQRIRSGGTADADALIARCKAEYHNPDFLGRCMALRASPWDAVQVIGACADAFDGDANSIQCLDSVRRAAVLPVHLIEACDLKYQGDDRELACLKRFEGMRYDGGNVVEACARVFTGSPNEVACMEKVAQEPSDPSAFVRACGQASPLDERRLTCLGRGDIR